MSTFKRNCLAIIVTTSSLSVVAADKEVKGLLPEVKIGGQENENEAKAYTSEILITRAENKALESLLSLLAKKKGTSEEPYLQYRLAELYMKRSKSGRFFDMQRTSKSAFPVPAESSAEHIRKAVQIYNKIAKDFPKFQDMDSVLFNNAFANQQLGLSNVSIHLYKELLARFPQSSLIPDARLATGELLYNQQNFAAAIEHFEALEKFPQARVYSYGMYKAAWTHYNLRHNDEAVHRLIGVVKSNPPLKPDEQTTNRHHLRKEAIRDLCVFIGESYSPDQVYPFFEKLTTPEELSQAMLDMGKIYLSYSKFKDMSVFLNAYLEDQPYGAAAVKANMLMVEAQENLKARENVIRHLQAASDLCLPQSKWVQKNSKEENIESCQERFKRDSLEIASKWWDIWLKNKQHKEFSSLTERAFAIILKNEDPKNPDFKTRFAYAELLFQQDKFIEASKEYQKVTVTNDAVMKHDSEYGVLYSLEKAIEKEPKNTNLKADRYVAAQTYVKNHPQGSHTSAVQFKMALLNYEEQKYKESMEQLQKLLAINPTLDIKTKAQDLVLDILNIQKDYKGIQSLADKMNSEKGLKTERSQQLTQIAQEAQFANIQILAESGKTKEALEELHSFIKKNPSSPLAEKAYLQVLGIQLKAGLDLAAAGTIMVFAEKYPKNAKTPEALKEAAQIYTQSGQFLKAIAIYEQLQKQDEKNKSAYTTKIINLVILERQYAKAKAIFETQLKTASKNETQDILSRLMVLSENANDQKTLQETETKILSHGFEPYTTQIMIKKAQKALDANNLSLAFDLSLKANARPSSSEVRAPARLIQARILEKEAINQSVKTKLDRLAMVLGMKTEKFDKAHTAYFSAAKMSSDAQQKAQALEGLDRLYRDYIKSLENVTITDTLSDEDQKALSVELAKMTEPMKQRLLENEAQLKVLRTGTGLSESSPFTGLLANESVKPRVQYPSAESVPALLPVKKWQELLDQRKFDLLEKEALAAYDQKDQRAQVLLALSTVAESKKQLEKAQWLADQSLNEKKSYEYGHFQRARIVYLLDKNIQTALPDFEKSESLKNSSSVLASILGIKAFSQGHHDEAIKNFSFAKKEDAINLEIGSLIAEAFAQKGETDKALSVIKEHIKANGNNVNLLLQEAHILETYKASLAPALDVYAKALKMSKSQEANAWLETKIKYLKTVLPN